MMVTSRERKLLKLLVDGLEPLLPSYYFTRVQKYEWLRRWGWKTDVVRVCPKGWEILINLEVYLPPEGSPFDHELVAQTGLANVLGSPYAGFNYPRLPFGDARFIDAILKAVPLGMQWLWGFNTPQRCLDRLLTPHTNPNSDGFRYRQRYLRSLPAELENVCCLVDAEWEYPNAYSRALFDVRHRGRLPKPD